MDGITDSITNLSKFQETVKDREAWRAAVRVLQRVRCDLTTEQQNIRLKGSNVKLISLGI